MTGATTAHTGAFPDRGSLSWSFHCPGLACPQTQNTPFKKTSFVTSVIANRHSRQSRSAVSPVVTLHHPVHRGNGRAQEQHVHAVERQRSGRVGQEGASVAFHVVGAVVTQGPRQRVVLRRGRRP